MLDLDECRKLANTLPDGLEADWDGSNHYQLTVPIPLKHADPVTWREWADHFWLDVREALGEEGFNACDDEQGRHLGLVLDITCQFKQLVTKYGELLDEVEQLRMQLDATEQELDADHA